MVVLIIVVGFIFAAISSGFLTSTAEGAEDKLNETSSGEVNSSVENASCQLKCTENHPTQGPGYYSCIQGCS